MHVSRPLLRYGLAIFLVLVALLLYLTTPLKSGGPYLLFIAAIVLSARFAGPLPTLVATWLSISASIFLLTLYEGEPVASLRAESVNWLVFALVCVIIAAVTYGRDRAEHAAKARARQQEAISNLGLRALATSDLNMLLNETTQIVCELLGTELCGVFRLQPDEKELLLLAGHGWHQGLIGRAKVKAGPDSQAGLTLLSQEPILVKNLRTEKRFSIQPLLADHDVTSGLSVTIPGDKRPFGVLGVYTTQTRSFTKGDVDFVQSVANVIATVAERKASEEAMRLSSEQHAIILEGVVDGITAQGPDGELIYANQAAAQMLGFKSPQDLIKTPVQKVMARFELLDEAGRPLPTDQLPGRLALQGQSGNGKYLRFRIQQTGEERWSFVKASPVMDQLGKVRFVINIFHDVTEQAKVQQDLSRLAAVVNSSDDAIYSKTLEGLLLSWNPGAERLFGYTAEEAIGQSVSMLYPPEAIEEFHEIVKRLKRGENIDHHDGIRVRKDGIRVAVSVSISLLKGTDGRTIGASSIVREITERKRAEEAQRFLARASDVLASSLDYPTTLQSIAQLAVPKIADWCTVDLLKENGAIEQVALAHADPAKIELANEFRRRYPPDPASNSGISQVLRSGLPLIYSDISDDQLVAGARDKEQLDLLRSLKLKSMMIVPLIARGHTLGALTFISAESGRRYGPPDLALAQDLARRAALSVDNARLYQESQKYNEALEDRVIKRTRELQLANQMLQEQVNSRRKATEQLRLLSAHLQSAREEERIRIARELHDEIGQIMTAVKMDLSLLRQKIVDENGSLKPESLLEDIEATNKLVDDSIQSMHHIIRELRPEILDHVGLRAAIEWQLQEFEARTKIECSFGSNLEDVSIDRDRSTAVFRIFQEALTNVARHADASRVEAGLYQNDGSLLLTVRDNGKGITQKQLEDASSFGLLGMQERAIVFGGRVAIGPAEGGGTIVSVWVPYEVAATQPISLTTG